MVSGERVLIGLLGAVSVALLIQGFQRGVMSAEFHDYDADDQPLRFAVTALGKTLAIAVCACYAAGYDLHDVWRFVLWLSKYA